MSEQFSSSDGAEQPQTGNEAVDGVLASLSALDGLQVDEHVGVYERAHDALRRALDEH